MQAFRLALAVLLVDYVKGNITFANSKSLIGSGDEIESQTDWDEVEDSVGDLDGGTANNTLYEQASSKHDQTIIEEEVEDFSDTRYGHAAEKEDAQSNWTQRAITAIFKRYW